MVETSEATTEDKSEETHENRDKYTTLVNLKTTDFLTTTEDYDHHNRSRFVLFRSLRVYRDQNTKIIGSQKLFSVESS